VTLYWRSILFAIFVFSYPIFVFCFINEHERKHYNYCYNAICELGIILTLGKYCYSKWSAFKDRKTIAVFIFTLLSFTCFSIGDFGFYSNFIKESADTYMQGYLYEMCYTLTFGFMAVALILHFKIYTQHPLVIAGIVAISTMYFFLTYHFLIAPMYNIYYSHLPYYRYVDIIIYNIFSSIVLGISASYCLRTLNLVEFMFLHSLLFLLAFDLTETYQLIQVNIIHPQAIETTIAQFFWSLTVGSMFLIVFLSWLHGQILFSHKKNLTDWYSVRVSLGLFIFGMNMLFSLALLIIRRYTIHNAIDVSVLLTVILLCWSISNALAFKVSSKFTEIGALMGTHKVKDVDFNSSNGLRLENINKRLNFSSEMNFIIEQYNKMADQFNLRGKKLIEFTNKKLIAEKHIVKVQIANQLAHDIASPLEAIRTILTLPKLDTDITRETLWTALSSITDMVGRLHFRSSGEQNSELKVYSAAATVEKIFIMKLAEFSELQVSLKLNITPTALNSFFKIDLDSFRSILSNIINNSRDELAKIRKDGQIIIELKKEEEAIFISVSDNGSTISEARLQQLNDGSFNSSKHSYKPLGIRSAKENLNRYNWIIAFF